MNIKLHIDELVLHGFEPNDRYAIGEAIQRELTWLLNEQGVPSSFDQQHSISRIDGGAYSLRQGTKVDVIGRQVAQRVYGGLK